MKQFYFNTSQSVAIGRALTLSAAFLLLFFSTPAKAQLYINEFLASNNTCFAGPEGDYPDWIEIYNAGSVAVDLGGYWMSDDLNEPDKREQIPTTSPLLTTVQPGQFILFYANGNAAGSVLNFNFKLSGNGEHIGLWMPDKTTVVDTLTYSAQTTDISMGRSPNGGSVWYLFNTPTPGASNPDYTGISNLPSNSLNIYPNPVKASSIIEFRALKSTNCAIDIYDLAGQKVSTIIDENITAGVHSYTLNAANLPQGIYFVKLITSEGSTTRKIQIIH
jgi:hypothetical protein